MRNWIEAKHDKEVGKGLILVALRTRSSSLQRLTWVLHDTEEHIWGLIKELRKENKVVEDLGGKFHLPKEVRKQMETSQAR